jgi:hypothetical protein
LLACKIELLLTAPHLLMINRSIPMLPRTIEVNHGGKGPKPNGFFVKIWTKANTRQ